MHDKIKFPGNNESNERLFHPFFYLSCGGKYFPSPTRHISLRFPKQWVVNLRNYDLIISQSTDKSANIYATTIYICFPPVWNKFQNCGNEKENPLTLLLLAEKILVSVICDEVQPKIQEAAQAACQGCMFDRPSQREHDCLKDSWDNKVGFFLWDAVGMTCSQQVMDTWVSILQRYPHGPTDMEAKHMTEDVLSLELMMNLNPNLLDAVQILLHTDEVFTSCLLGTMNTCLMMGRFLSVCT